MRRLIFIPKQETDEQKSAKIEAAWGNIQMNEQIRKDFNILSLPNAENGVLDSCIELLDGEFFEATVCGLVSSQVNVTYGIAGNVAIIEAGSCVGLNLIDKKWNFVNATTFGVGELIMRAAQPEIENIILSIGKVAADDGGIGMAAAMGFRFYDENEMDLAPLATNMVKIRHIESPTESFPAKILIICECGDLNYRKLLFRKVGRGTQELLDAGLKNLAEVIKSDLKIDVSNIMENMGGLAAGVSAFLNGSILSVMDFSIGE